MPCKRMTFADGSTAIFCTREKSRKCTYCGGRANLLCDWTLPNGKTCDLPICSKCSTPEGPDKGFCKVHTHCDGANR